MKTVMKKLILSVAFCLAASLALAGLAEARGAERHRRRDSGRHRVGHTRRPGLPRALGHSPRRRVIVHHPVHRRPRHRPYRGFVYWPFALSYWGAHHHHGFDCPDEHYHADTQEPASTAYEAGDGWRQLAEGESFDAARIFSEQAESDPGDGVARIGLGLASAATGDLARGVWAMRAGLRIDALSVRYVPVDRGVAGRIRALVSAYRAEADTPAKRADYSFMLAALHYLLDERVAALDEVTLAIKYGDRSDSANNLDRMLRGEKVVVR